MLVENVAIANDGSFALHRYMDKPDLLYAGYDPVFYFYRVELVCPKSCASASHRVMFPANSQIA